MFQHLSKIHLNIRQNDGTNLYAGRPEKEVGEVALVEKVEINIRVNSIKGMKRALDEIRKIKEENPHERYKVNIEVKGGLALFDFKKF